jgi:hypothetical protein
MEVKHGSKTKKITFGSSKDEILMPLLEYTKLGRQRNVDIGERLKIQSIIKAMQTYLRN